MTEAEAADLRKVNLELTEALRLTIANSQDALARAAEENQRLRDELAGKRDSWYSRYLPALDRATVAEERCRLLESRARPFGWRTKIQFALLFAVLLGLPGCGMCQRDPHSGFHVCAGVLP